MARNPLSNLYFIDLPNCMGLSERGKCIWQNNAVCKGEKCKIKRSEGETQSAQIKTSQRLASLSDSQQTHIADKYYGGKKPWIKASKHDKQNNRKG